MSGDKNYSHGPVPISARKGGLALTFVMLGLTFFSASMWTGGALGTGLSFNDFFLAVLIGNLLLGVYTAFLGFIGSKTGLTTHLLARYSFGIKGSGSLHSYSAAHRSAGSASVWPCLPFRSAKQRAGISTG